MNKRRRYKAKRRRARARFYRDLISMVPRGRRGRVDDGTAEYADYFFRVIVPHIRLVEDQITAALGVPPELMVEGVTRPR